MATNLYEILGLDRNASPEDIRKAYRKRALKTHPDRLLPQTSEAEKAAATEEFRKINNAYEVLSNEQNRQLYDRYGVWPPSSAPEPTAHRASTSYNQHHAPFNEAFSDPFFGSPFGGGRPFVFTDPFVLFNQLFGDIHDMHRSFFEGNNSFFSDPFPSPFTSPPFASPFGRSVARSPFDSFFGQGPLFSRMLDSPDTRAYGQVSEAVGRNGQWVSQSTMTRSINGRTEQITKRQDAQGNEHVVYSSPEGERYTIDGVDQPLPVTNGNRVAGQMASTPVSQPQPQTRLPPQAITAATPPAPSYFVPPPAQPVQTRSSPYRSHSVSTASRAGTYTTRPAPPFDRAPACHADANAMDVDPPAGRTMYRHRSTSSHGHGSGYASPVHSQRSDADRYRDSRGSYHRSRHGSAADSHRGQEGEKKWRGW